MDFMLQIIDSLRRKALPLLFAVALFLPPAAAAGTHDWPQWRGPNLDGVSTESSWASTWPQEGPKILWRAEVGVGFSSCSVADGRVYTMGNRDDTDTVWCFDAATGKVLWTHKYASPKGSYPGPRMTPTVDGDSVYTLGRWGDLYCLGAKDGKVRWYKNVAKEYGARQTKYKWGFACSPLVLGKLLILDLGKVLALEKESGKLVWSSGDDYAGYSSPAVMTFGGKKYVTSFNAYGFVLVDAAGGKELARYKWKTEWLVNAATPIPVGDKIFISSGYNHGCALLQVKGKELVPLYENKNMRNHCNSSVLYKGYLYGFDGQQGSRGRLVCLDFETGTVGWEKSGLRVGALMIAGGKIVAMLDKGDLLTAEASPDGYRELARAKVLKGKCWTYPVLSGGRIYCRSNVDGVLVCVDASGK